MSDLFTTRPEAPTTPQEVDLPQGSYYDALVGDDKKFKNTESLARGKYESDLYVTQLQSENAGMRAKLTEQESVADLLDKAMKPQETQVSESIPVSAEPATPILDSATPVLTQEDIQKLVDKQVNSRLNKQEKADNVAMVHAKAKEAYGDDYTKVLVEKAEKHGLGQTFLAGLAEDQPSAFLQLMVEERTTDPVPPVIPAIPTGSSVTPGVSLQKKNYAHYVKLQKDLGDAAYFKPAIQNEMFKQLQEQGEEAFYS